MKEQRWKAVFAAILMLAGIFLGASGLQQHWRGMHNVDLSFNMSVLGLEDETDTTTTGPMTYRELYTVGLEQMQWGIWALAMGAALWVAGMAIVVEGLWNKP
jgi:hypothetical protein